MLEKRVVSQVFYSHFDVFCTLMSIHKPSRDIDIFFSLLKCQGILSNIKVLLMQNRISVFLTSKALALFYQDSHLMWKTARFMRAKITL